MRTEERFMHLSYFEMCEYIEKLESEVKSKNDTIKELIYENAKLEVVVERYE